MKNKTGKYALIILLIIAAIMLIITIAIMLRRRSDDTDRVPLDEVAAELTFGGYENGYWEDHFASYKTSYLTGDIANDIVTALGIADVIANDHSGGALLRQEWNDIYSQILGVLDMKGEVESRTVLVLDILDDEEVSVIITNDGEYAMRLQHDILQIWYGYDVYINNGFIVGIADGSEGESTLSNAYVTAASYGIDFLYGGASYEYETDKLADSINDGVCDLIFSCGELIAIRTKTDTIEGNLLSYDSGTIEIEKYGHLPCDDKLAVYELWGEVTQRSISDVVLGNMDVEYVTGDGKVCAILITKPASLENVRVLLLAPDGSDYRESVFLRSEGAITVQCGSYEETIECGIVIDVRDYEGLYAGETAIFTALQDEAISICDEDGAVLGNGYMGHIEVRYYDEGYTVINQLPLEDYLTAVVPSEMPSSYEPEALKAQAICARSYACIQLLKGDLARYGAHINDSASYQVYNKVAPTEASIRAVYETAGQILTYEGDIVEAYYFSTSMGYTDTAAVWNVSDEGSYGYLGKVCLNYEDTVDDLSDEEGFYDYITSENTGYDSDIKFYRWQAAVDFSDMAGEVISALTSRYSTTSDNIKIYDNDMNEMTEGFQKLGEVKEISVEERSASGAVLCLKITFNKGTAYIKNEYNIRKISGCALSHITWKDGSENNEMTILPSSFFSPVRQKDGSYILYGGGYGHGLGMSQNGANGMAKSGADCEEILQYFYHDIKIEKM